MVPMARKDLKVTFEGYVIIVKVEYRAKAITGFMKNTKVNKHGRTVEQQEDWPG
mgnify:CR=1 FL=1